MAKSANQIEICTCGCEDTDKFVQDAYPLIKEGELPPIYHSSELLTDPARIQMVKALEKTKQAYAYLFDGEEVWDILKGVRIQ